MIEMKGKLVQLSDCYCCSRYNTKKIKINEDNSYIKEGFDFFAKTEPGVIGYDGTDEYQHVAKLFSKIGKVQIWCDTPFGDEVILVDGKFKGYINEWIEMIQFCDDSNFLYNSPDDVYDYYLVNALGIELGA